MTPTRTARRALIVVDVQNDFVEGGALAVNGGRQVASRISSYLAGSVGRYAVVVASRDWHDPDGDNGGHFAAPDHDPDFVDTWPDHCVAGTLGAEYAPELAQRHLTHAVKKGTGEPAYSAFQGTAADGRALGDILTAARVEDVDVVGIATDFCVKATALDAAAAGYTTTVLLDLTAAVAPERADAIVADLTAGGVEVVGALAGAGR